MTQYLAYYIAELYENEIEFTVYPDAVYGRVEKDVSIKGVQFTKDMMIQISIDNLNKITIHYHPLFTERGLKLETVEEKIKYLKEYEGEEEGESLQNALDAGEGDYDTRYEVPSDLENPMKIEIVFNIFE